MSARETIGGVEIVTPDEGIELFDRIARQDVGMSGEEFVRAWGAGEFDDNPDRPELWRLVALLPLFRRPCDQE